MLIGRMLTEFLDPGHPPLNRFSVRCRHGARMPRLTTQNSSAFDFGPGARCRPNLAICRSLRPPRSARPTLIAVIGGGVTDH